MQRSCQGMFLSRSQTEGPRQRILVWYLQGQFIPGSKPDGKEQLGTTPTAESPRRLKKETLINLSAGRPGRHSSTGAFENRCAADDSSRFRWKRVKRAHTRPHTSLVSRQRAGKSIPPGQNTGVSSCFYNVSTVPLDDLMKVRSPKATVVKEQTEVLIPGKLRPLEVWSPRRGERVTNSCGSFLLSAPQ
ncbi:hypothetical protein DPEC_G00219830 [Dallia pectoralis]|uniref:Uncharacterized protein n=1 Tax=Dallia pectoralis TaxID=75939 RepID=A0ACC2G3G7_DALPE|nr:hypothetical protein DPEC_G00219830 [Dallia pectoralis]